jgi:hypothetical protein
MLVVEHTMDAIRPTDAHLENSLIIASILPVIFHQVLPDDDTPTSIPRLIEFLNKYEFEGIIVNLRIGLRDRLMATGTYNPWCAFIVASALGDVGLGQASIIAATGWAQMNDTYGRFYENRAVFEAHAEPDESFIDGESPFNLYGAVDDLERALSVKSTWLLALTRMMVNRDRDPWTANWREVALEWARDVEEILMPYVAASEDVNKQERGKVKKFV